MKTAPYGTWQSPISARLVAEGRVRLEEVGFGAGGSLWWSEGRPAEQGRSVVVTRRADGTTVDALPPGFNARTRVHEYGGAAWTVMGTALVFANWDDQRLYLVDGRDPTPLTPEPAQPQGDRYADLVASPAGDEVWCVRERASGDGVERHIVAVPLDGSGRVRTLVADGHFLSNPRPSPDGRHLAWLTWDHPRMPWDGTELRVAPIAGDGSIAPAATVLGGEEESVFQPEWAGPDALYAVSDRSGWWNLYRVGLGGGVTALWEAAEEFGAPQWQFGMATYGVLANRRLAVLHGVGRLGLSILDPATGSRERVDTPLEDWAPRLRVDGNRVADICGGPLVAACVATLDVGSGQFDVARSALDVSVDQAYLPEPRAQSFPGLQGRKVHAFVYPPHNPDFGAPGGERPPFVAFVHGGPTSQTDTVLNPMIAFFTSRGFGVVDINYGGSTGYGREYRNRLAGQWGIVDVQDVVAAVQGLAQQEEADGDRLLIRGGSAGGWTVLAALTGTDVFAGGASYYGVADLMGLVEDTHDFESRYMDGLVGPLPQSRRLYAERSPLSHVDEVSCPILLLQGLEDKIVTPRQAEMFRDALQKKGITHAYLAFEGEQHGFRRAENVERALEAELSFYGQVLGFVPPDVPVLPLAGATPTGA